MASDLEETRATARLPQLDIDIVHRRSSNAEMLSITLQAMPSFRAFEQLFDAANPFLFWARMATLAWQPWLAAMQPGDAPRQLPPPKRKD